MAMEIFALVYLAAAFFYAYLYINGPDGKYLVFLKLIYIGMALIMLCGPFVIQNSLVGSPQVDYITTGNVTYNGGILENQTIGVTQPSVDALLNDYNMAMLGLNILVLLVTAFIWFISYTHEIAEKTLDTVNELRD